MFVVDALLTPTWDPANVCTVVALAENNRASRIGT
jgi:hypothetical protein